MCNPDTADLDGNITNGCECVATSVTDLPDAPWTIAGPQDFAGLGNHTVQVAPAGTYPTLVRRLQERFANDLQIEAVHLGDGLPIGDARAAHGIDADGDDQRVDETDVVGGEQHGGAYAGT